MLPKMPSEVFDTFLVPLIINDIDWPFLSIYDSLNGTDWYRILYPFSLSSLSKLKWKLSSFLLNKDILCKGSQDDIDMVILNKTTDVWALIGRDSKPSRDSLAWHKKNIITTGRLSAPVAVAVTPLGIKILDGHHRITALFDLGVQGMVPIDAWIGE
ncbi:MAG: hypothetical protein WC581_04960 [Thermodesulfovibrionales bacterium]